MVKLHLYNSSCDGRPQGCRLLYCSQGMIWGPNHAQGADSGRLCPTAYFGHNRSRLILKDTQIRKRAGAGALLPVHGLKLTISDTSHDLCKRS